MPRDELMEIMAAVRASIARIAEARTSDDRALKRALAHLWSAYDELELSSSEGARRVEARPAPLSLLRVSAG